MVREKSPVQEAIDAFTKYCDNSDSEPQHEFIRDALMYNILATIAGSKYKFPELDESKSWLKINIPLDR